MALMWTSGTTLSETATAWDFSMNLNIGKKRNTFIVVTF